MLVKTKRAKICDRSYFCMACNNYYRHPLAIVHYTIMSVLIILHYPERSWFYILFVLFFCKDRTFGGKAF